MQPRRRARRLPVLADQPLAARSRETYAQQVGWFCDWLGAGGPGPGVLADPVTRDHAARDYKAHLKELGAAHREYFGNYYPATTLVEVSNFFEDGVLVEIEGIAVLA